MTSRKLDLQQKSEAVTVPGQYARPASSEITNNTITYHGKQQYILTHDLVKVLDEDQNLKSKHAMLAPYFIQKNLTNRSVLDLGANVGFFSFFALQKTARSAIAVDGNSEDLNLIRQGKDKFGFQNLDLVNSNFENWDQPADIVLALDFPYWAGSYTRTFGSVEAGIEKLAKLTNYLLITEWIDPEDSETQGLDKIYRAAENNSSLYSFKAFAEALGAHFVRVEHVGEISGTRHIFAAYKYSNEIDLSCPLPLLYPLETLISSRLLVLHRNMEYWSQVYDLGQTIVKQSTVDLASREALFLNELVGPHYPRVIEVSTEAGRSILTIEKIDGIPLDKTIPQIRSSKASIYKFFLECLEILADLSRRGIQHRDIRAGNFMVRDGKPVLLDFGWAVSPKHPYFTPAGLGAEYSPPDGAASDVFSMGLIFKEINQNGISEFDPLIRLMTAPDFQFRVVDPDLLTYFFNVAASGPGSTITEG